MNTDKKSRDGWIFSFPIVPAAPIRVIRGQIVFQLHRSGQERCQNHFRIREAAMKPGHRSKPRTLFQIQPRQGAGMGVSMGQQPQIPMKHAGRICSTKGADSRAGRSSAFRFALILLAVLAFATPPARAAVTEAWVQRYNGPANSSDQPMASWLIAAGT